MALIARQQDGAKNFCHRTNTKACPAINTISFSVVNEPNRRGKGELEGKMQTSTEMVSNERCRYGRKNRKIQNCLLGGIVLYLGMTMSIHAQPPVPPLPVVPLPSFLAPGVTARIQRVLDSQLAEKIIAFSKCVKAGGDPLKCLGQPPSASPFPPPSPKAVKAFLSLSRKQRQILKYQVISELKGLHELEVKWVNSNFK